jgi:DNA repair exonuclease SbcCD ATPase subunit
MSDKIDYLTEDKPLTNQKFVCLSFLSPEGVSNCKIRGLKVRGVYETYEEATERAKLLRDTDKHFHVFVGEVGKWLPWDPEPDSKQVKDAEYAENELNNLMKAYKKNQKAAEKYEETRKSELLEKSLQENLEIRKKTKKEVQTELDKFIDANDDTNDKEKLIIQENLEKTLKTIDEEINKLEKMNKNMSIDKKDTEKKLESVQVSEDEIKKTEDEIEKVKQQLNALA